MAYRDSHREEDFMKVWTLRDPVESEGVPKTDRKDTTSKPKALQGLDRAGAAAGLVVFGNIRYDVVSPANAHSAIDRLGSKRAKEAAADVIAALALPLDYTIGYVYATGVKDRESRPITVVRIRPDRATDEELLEQTAQVRTSFHDPSIHHKPEISIARAPSISVANEIITEVNLIGSTIVLGPAKNPNL